MEKPNFENKPIKLKPKTIIKEEQEDDFDNFFLVLGLIYNDLKSLLFYSVELEGYFKDKDTVKISCNMGEYHGMRNHLTKLIVSVLHEFLLFIEKNPRIINSTEFGIFLKKLNSDERILWEEMINIANKKDLTDKGNNILTSLAIIRNNGSFHYWRTASLLRKGFTEHFFNKYGKDTPDEPAYYSKGESMRDTRYFFSDAAMQGLLYNTTKDKIAYEEYIETLRVMVEKINFVIMALMNKYIASRK